MKNIIFFHLKIIVFTAMENCSILHGRVFVMSCTVDALVDLWICCLLKQIFS